MRPIDGDELWEKAYEVWGLEADAGDTSIFMDMITDCPTIDPVKHEYWIGFDTTAYTGQDNSGEPIFSLRRFYRCHGCRNGTAVKMNYCPKCGARMDADE